MLHPELKVLGAREALRFICDCAVLGRWITASSVFISPKPEIETPLCGSLVGCGRLRPAPGINEVPGLDLHRDVLCTGEVLVDAPIMLWLQESLTSHRTSCVRGTDGALGEMLLSTPSSQACKDAEHQSFS